LILLLGLHREQRVRVLLCEESVALMPGIKVNWSRQIITDVNPVLRKFERWLNEQGYRDACISSYLRPIARFLKETGSANPTLEDAKIGIAIWPSQSWLAVP
jgi:hypothetical protein